MNKNGEIKEKEAKLQDKVSEFYEEIRYKKHYSKQWHDKNLNRMINLINADKLKKGKILDNGCGTGILGDFLPTHNITGSDISREMVAKAKRKLSTAIVADSEALPFSNDTFDVIFARSLLHHLPDPEKGIYEAYRIIKPGGQIVFQDTLLSIFSFLPRKFANWRGEHFNESHRNFSKKELVKIIEKKFVIDKILFSGYFAYLLGFPDVFDVSKYIPIKKIIIPLLYNLDKLIEKIPLVRNQSWGIIILAHKE